MPALQLTHAQLRQMVDHTQAELPNEACGLLAGVDACVTQVLPIANMAANPQQAFEMEPIGLLRALRQIDAAGLVLVGIYHSHPRSNPIPSQHDIVSAQLNFPQIAHVIISFKQAKPRLQAWQIRPTEIDAVELKIGKGHTAFARENSLTHAQQYAILLAALLAFVVMLSLSFALLPPAPMITPIAP